MFFRVRLEGNADFGLSFISITNGEWNYGSVFGVDTLNLLDEQDGNVDGSIPLVFSQPAVSQAKTQSIELDFGS